MVAHLTYTETPNSRVEIQVTGSKSESNRLLILQALYPKLVIHNLSESDDTRYLSAGVSVRNREVDIHHAGTAMRFLTAYFATREGVDILLTGSDRMKERPISILVDALRNLGCNIEYAGEKGFPPLRIRGKQITTRSVTIDAGVSSQYISALMLIAPSLSDGLSIHLNGKVTSVPYIKMTLSLLEQLGINGRFEGHSIHIPSVKSIEDTQLVVESDWSSASYFYSLVALGSSLSVKIKSYRKDSLQGDSALPDIYSKLGVRTEFLPDEQALVLTKDESLIDESLKLDLSDTPDLAQTIAVSCFGLGMDCELTGLHTLKIKETDRLVALHTELTKLGAMVEITDKSLSLRTSSTIHEQVSISTYNDHRMAMAFAPLALLVPISIEDPEVVSKSFPTFWEDMAKVGIQKNAK